MAFKNPLDKLSFETKGWITLFSGFALHFILGTFYLWGSISTYTTSYLVQDGQDYTKEDVGAVFPFTFLAINIGTPFGVSLAQRLGFRLTIFIGSILIGCATIISSFVVNIFPLFVLFYGVIFGLLNGLLYMVPFNTCYLYLPHRKGLVSGVIAGGFGFGSTAFIWLMYGIVNPDNEKASDVINGVKYFSKDVCDNYPKALRVLGIVQMIIGVLSCIIHIRPSQEELKANEENLRQKMIAMGQQVQPKVSKGHSSTNLHEKASQDNHQQKQQTTEVEKANATESDTLKGDRSPPNKSIRPAIENQQLEQVALPIGTVSPAEITDKKSKKAEVYVEFQTFKEGLRTKFIYYTIALAFMFTVYGTMTVSNYKLYGEYNNYDDSFLSTVGTVGSIFNGISRIFWGSLMEKFTIHQIIFVNVSIQICISFTYRWVAEYGALFFIWTVLGYFCYGGWLSVLPTLVTRVYGKKIGTSIYGITFFGFALASFVQYFLVKEVQKAINWGYTFWVFTGIQIIAMIVSFIMRFNATPPPSQKEEEVKPLSIVGSDQKIPQENNIIPQQA